MPIIRRKYCPHDGCIIQNTETCIYYNTVIIAKLLQLVANMLNKTIKPLPEICICVCSYIDVYMCSQRHIFFRAGGGGDGTGAKIDPAGRIALYI